MIRQHDFYLINWLSKGGSMTYAGAFKTTRSRAHANVKANNEASGRRTANCVVRVKLKRPFIEEVIKYNVT